MENREEYFAYMTFDELLAYLQDENLKEWHAYLDDMEKGVDQVLEVLEKSDEDCNLVHCIGSGREGEGCGLVQGKSGSVCDTCGGMLLSSEVVKNQVENLKKFF